MWSLIRREMCAVGEFHCYVLKEVGGGDVVVLVVVTAVAETTDVLTESLLTGRPLH